MSKPKELHIKAESRKTEMGFEVRAFSQQVNVAVEFDLDYEPEFAYALLQMMPQIIVDQMAQHLGVETDA